jgi:hypothetical protein
MRRILAAVLILLAGSASARAYVHFLRYVNRDGRPVALPAKFDLGVLPNRTVHFYITDQSPERMAAGDTMPALTSQIRLAARQWNDVDTSELRLAYGGIVAAETPAAPGIDVVFGDVPPGLLALAGVTTSEPGAGASFVPIQRSQVVLSRDLSEQPSFAEQTFLTIVHEFGHALGLQHTQTASAMSTALTRSQTKGRALSADDIAGISLLYPARSFQSGLGSISGRVTNGGNGVPLASVVALAPNGAAVGVLTGPDGTYRIEGIPPGSYGVYVQPLPAPQTGEVTPDNLMLPLDPERRPIQPVRNLDTLFFPGVRESAAATLLPVAAGASIEGINFSVATRAAAPRLFNVQSFSFPGQVAVRPAHVSFNGSRPFFVATGNGLMTSATQATAGLQASLFGSQNAVSGIRPYSANFLQFDLNFPSPATPGVRHGVFSAPGELYVQPAVVTFTSQQPPQISQVSLMEGRTVTLTGSNLTAETRILADGVPALVRTAEPDRLTVTLPPAQAGHRAVVTAINPDGQSSLFLQGNSPSTHVYEPAEPILLSVSPSSLPAGIEAAIEISASGANFVEGWAAVGFGSSDVLVRRIWVLSPTRLLVQVHISAGAAPGPLAPVVITGLRAASGPGAFSIASGTPRLPVGPAFTNPLTGIGTANATANLSASATVGTGEQILVLVGGGASTGTPAFTIADRPAAATVVGPGIFGVQIPAGLPAGPAIIRVQSGADISLPFAIQLDNPTEIAWEGSRILTRGEVAQIAVSGFAINPLVRPRVTVSIAGIEHAAQLRPNGQVAFTPVPGIAPGNHPFNVSIDGRMTPTISVTVQ